ncbi:hypothetical protein D1007_37798 [Hordeum vulgare]|nr:hypothetical protein D1007_37798 [Hordeum vulgare]
MGRKKKRARPSSYSDGDDVEMNGEEPAAAAQSKSLYEEASEKFQQLQKLISILGDQEKRAIYDEIGITEDDVST